MTTEPKMSKNGWPLGVYNHRITSCHKSIFDALSRKLLSRFGFAAGFKEYTHDSNYGDVMILARMSMETYGNVKNFIEGYKAASY